MKWLFLIWLALVATDSRAITLWRFCRHGVSGQATLSTPPPIVQDLDALEPEFVFKREGIRIVLLETHSQTTLQLTRESLIARVTLSQKDVVTHAAHLDDDEVGALRRLWNADTVEMAAKADRDILTKVFHERIVPTLFHPVLENLAEAEAEPLAQAFLQGASRWSIKRGEELIGYQMEGWVNKNGALANYDETGRVHWAIAQVLFRDGVVEFRAIDTRHNAPPGFYFRREPLANHMFERHGHGELRSGFDAYSLQQHAAILGKGVRVNGNLFPHGHVDITRAREIGLDPNRGYHPLDLSGLTVVANKGSMDGKLFTVVSHAEGSYVPGGGFRSNLNLRPNGMGTVVALPSSYVTPLFDFDVRLSQGLDPVTGKPLSLAGGQEVVVRATSERGWVVEVQGFGSEAIYQIRSSDPKTTELKEFTIVDLIPARYYLAPPPAEPASQPQP